MYAIITETEMIGWFARPVEALAWLLEQGSVEVLEIQKGEPTNPYIIIKVKWGQKEVMIDYWSYTPEAEAYPPKPFRKVE